MATTRKNFIAAQDMTDALAKEAEKQDRDEASIIRDALRAYLKERGHKLTMKVEHGGRRPYGDKEQTP